MEDMPDDVTDAGDGAMAMNIAARHAIAYRRQVALSDVTPVRGYPEMLAAFSEPLPARGEVGEVVIADLVERASPGIRATTGPRFFGWVVGGSHTTGVAADWLTSAWGQNAGNTLGAPAASAVEAVAADWLLELLGLPKSASVGFVTGATVANFVCLAAARSEVLRLVGWDVEADGLFGAPPITVLISEEAHATVFAALKYLGLGAARVRSVRCDHAGRMIPAEFSAALEGINSPCIAILQAGQINTGASDPFMEIIPMAKAAGAWCHVDGAFGLWAQAAPAYAHLTAGVELADSWATDGHKWLQTPYDCGYAIVRDQNAHRRAMAVSASYLAPANDAAREPSAYVPELSRRARGFSTWAMIRQLGRTGISRLVAGDCELARHMAERLSAHQSITLLNEVELNQFMLSFGEGATAEALTLATIKQVQEDAVTFVSASQWHGQWVMRISVSSIATTLVDAERSIEAVLDAWDTVRTAAGRGAG